MKFLVWQKLFLFLLLLLRGLGNVVNVPLIGFEGVTGRLEIDRRSAATDVSLSE